jgi:hypothetical protein
MNPCDSEVKKMGLTESISCQNCGAPLTLKAGEVVITCEYCGTALNIASGKDFFLKHSIIPSRKDEKATRILIRKWMGDGPLKPSNMESKSKILDMALVFLPFYIVHANVTTSYRGYFTRTGEKEPRDGKLHREYYWKILGRRGSSFPTKEYEIPLTGKEDFNLSKIPDGARYLNAEFDEKDAEDIAKVEMMDHQKYLISEQVNELSDIQNEFEVEDIEFVHAPIWRIDYSYSSKDYQILLDSASGVIIRGDIPPPDQSVGGFFSDIKRAFFGK